MSRTTESPASIAERTIPESFSSPLRRVIEATVLERRSLGDTAIRQADSRPSTRMSIQPTGSVRTVSQSIAHQARDHRTVRRQPLTINQATRKQQHRRHRPFDAREFARTLGVEMGEIDVPTARGSSITAGQTVATALRPSQPLLRQMLEQLEIHRQREQMAARQLSQLIIQAVDQEGLIQAITDRVKAFVEFQQSVRKWNEDI